MKKALLILLLATSLLPAGCQAEKSAVLVIIDGMGSSYIYPEHTPLCLDGSLLPVIRTGFLENATARYELWVPTPETESGNAVIVTGYSGATQDAFAYFGATIYDVLRSEGYLSIAIMETGDNADMRKKPDIIVHERNNSVYNPDVAIVINSESVPSDIRNLLLADPPARLKTSTDHDSAYLKYDKWPLDKATELVGYMRDRYPGQKYLLVLSVGGTDMAAQEQGYKSYGQAIADLDPGLALLAEACQASGDVLLVTADHGMSFKSPASKGSHASGEASLQNESCLAPLLVFSEVSGIRSGTFGQECLAPTLLSLMECPDTLTIEDGEPIPVSDSASLYLISDAPENVLIEGPGFTRSVTVNGTCRIGSLSAGRYTISSLSWTRAVELDRDRTVKIGDREAAVGWNWDWLPYAAVATISALGLAVALRLLKRR
ncbi:MAG TPA: arylsulfatase [Methanocella sp.]|jgi:hypothetical protein